MKNKIPFNIDSGEGMQNEHLIFPYIEWCNISCGAHAGSIEEIEATILLAQKFKLKIGAHPSYPDKKNFGRLVMKISKEELTKSLIQQLIDFKYTCQKLKVELHHIKPHGALYHQIAENESVANIFFNVLKDLKLEVGIIGPPNSLFEVYCQKYNLPFYAEAFADRRYEEDGRLKKRSEKGSVLSDPEEIKKQVLCLLKENSVLTEDEKKISLTPNTICFHGDHEGCDITLRKIHEFLTNEIHD